MVANDKDMNVFFKETVLGQDTNIPDINGNKYHMIDEITVETNRYCKLLHYVYKDVSKDEFFIVAYKNGISDLDRSEYCDATFSDEHNCNLIEAHRAKVVMKEPTTWNIKDAFKPKALLRKSYEIC